jgi:hypothetical protein
VLHLLTVLIGRARLWWDLEIRDDYLPNWGIPGNIGENLAEYPTDATRDVQPLPCHSHNDYWRRVPLYDALHWGCTGVEADVWLSDDELYVGHHYASLTKNRTFHSLYIGPLVELLDHINLQNDSSDVVVPNSGNASKHGVFDADPSQTLVLLVDLKTDGDETFRAVSRQLEPLREKNYLSYWDGEKTHNRAVTVVGTGNTPFEMVIENVQYRDIFMDAPLDQLWEAPQKSSGPRNEVTDRMDVGAFAYDTSNSYYASVSFLWSVGVAWRGRLSSHQLEIIRGQIQGAHRQGLKARYWDTPFWPVEQRNHIWRVLMEEGADILNVDDLRAAAVENWKAKVYHWW